MMVIGSLMNNMVLVFFNKLMVVSMMEAGNLESVMEKQRSHQLMVLLRLVCLKETKSVNGMILKK